MGSGPMKSVLNIHDNNVNRIAAIKFVAPLLRFQSPSQHCTCIFTPPSLSLIYE